jgi:hypothetical protein
MKNHFGWPGKGGVRGWLFPFFVLIQASNMAPAKQTTLCLFSGDACEAQSLLHR